MNNPSLIPPSGLCGPARRAVAAAAVAVLVLAGAAGRSHSQGEDILGGQVQKEIMSETELRAEIEKLENRVASNSGNYRLHFQLGNLYYDAGMYEPARERYEKVLELNPKYAEALVNLGSVSSDLGEQEEAIDFFRQALALDPEDCKARSNLGNAYYALSRYPDAIYEYERAIEIDPKCYPALYNMGVAFADVGMFREAVKWWMKVVAAAPGTEAAANAEENIKILDRFTSAPIPPPKGSVND